MARRYPATHQVAAKFTQPDLDALDALVDRLPEARRNRSQALRLAVRLAPPAAFRNPDSADVAWLALPSEQLSELAELATRFGTTIDYVLAALLNEPNARATVKRGLAEIALAASS